MSRSRRKNPIIGHTNCQSERQDKKIWHQRLRSRERTALTNLSSKDLSDYLPVLKNEVSSVWVMGKEGHSYWALTCQIKKAKCISDRQGCNVQERLSLKKRLLHKWMGK